MEIKRLLVPFLALALCPPAQAQLRPLFESETNIEMRQQTEIDIRLPDIKAPDVDVDVHIPKPDRPTGVHGPGEWMETDYVLMHDLKDCKFEERFVDESRNAGIHGLCALFMHVDMNSITQRKGSVSFRWAAWFEYWSLNGGKRTRHWDKELSPDGVALTRCPSGDIYDTKQRKWGHAPKMKTTAKFVCSLL